MSVLTNNEAGRGWTHIKVIQGVDLTESTDSTAQTIPVAVIPAGSIVEAVAVKLVTAFDDSGSGSYLNVIVGDTDNDNGYIESWEIHTDQGNSTAQVINGAYLNDSTTNNVVNGKLYDGTANVLNAILTPAASGGAYNLSECTAGELRVYARIAELV